VKYMLMSMLKRAMTEVKKIRTYQIALAYRRSQSPNLNQTVSYAAGIAYDIFPAHQCPMDYDAPASSALVNTTIHSDREKNIRYVEYHT
jgi:hypothetical protein